LEENQKLSFSERMMPPRNDSVIPAAAIDGLMRQMGLASLDALMLALLPEAQALARPVISRFHVGAVGRAQPSGDLLLGANIEFRGGSSADTIHAEQFLFSRAFHRGVRLDRIAVSARPCGHCRQFMAEFEGREALTILDPGGGRLSLAEMLPWSFTPADLGEAGAGPETGVARAIEADAPIDPALRDALAAAGGRAYAPYSRAPSAVVLRLADGALFSGAGIENAAYNPGLPPLQAALINLIAAGHDYGDIVTAVLGMAPDAALDHSGATRRLLGVIAPHARCNIVTWRAPLSS
jgi:cytidine deaminase